MLMAVKEGRHSDDTDLYFKLVWVSHRLREHGYMPNNSARCSVPAVSTFLLSAINSGQREALAAIIALVGRPSGRLITIRRNAPLMASFRSFQLLIQQKVLQGFTTRQPLSADIAEFSPSR